MKEQGWFAEVSEGPLAVRFAPLLSEHISACIKRLTPGKVQPLEVQQWAVFQGNQNGAGGETAPQAHRQPGEPGTGGSTTVKLPTVNIYCRPISLFHSFLMHKCLPKPTDAHIPPPVYAEWPMSTAASSSTSTSMPMVRQCRAQGGCQSLSISACCSALAVHYWLHESHDTEWRTKPFKQDSSESQSMRIWLYKHSDLKVVSDLSIFLQIPSNWCESNPEI